MLHSVWRRSGPRRARPLACEQLEDRSLLSFIVQTPFHATGTNPAVPVTADFFQHNQLDLAVTNNNLGGTNGSVAIYENTTSSPTDDITFVETQEIPVGREPIGMVAGQLTSSGLNDL